MSGDLHVKDANRFAGLTYEDLNEDEFKCLTQLVLDAFARHHIRGQPLPDLTATQAYLRLRSVKLRAEHFGVLFLDVRQRILADEVLFHGTLDRARVYPRIVVQRALEINAAEVLIYHNHTSGTAEPSGTDKFITRLLKDALALVEVRVLDHIIVSSQDSVSFVERGLL